MFTNQPSYAEFVAPTLGACGPLGNCSGKKYVHCRYKDGIERSSCESLFTDETYLVRAWLHESCDKSGPVGRSTILEEADFIATVPPHA